MLLSNENVDVQNGWRDQQETLLTYLQSGNLHSLRTWIKERGQDYPAQTLTTHLFIPLRRRLQCQQPTLQALLAILDGVLINYIGSAKGDPVLLFGGVALVIVAIVLNGIAYKMISRGNRSAASSRGIVLALLAGLLMSFFYRFVAASMDLDNFVTPAAGKMTPYSAMVVFAVGIFLSTFIFNSIAMKRPVSGTPVSISAYFKGGFPIHLVGVLGGVIWGLGNALNLIAAGKAGAAISYGLGQGATLVAALWGVFVWKEFRGGGRRVDWLLGWMFALFVAGIGLIIAAGN